LNPKGFVVFVILIISCSDACIDCGDGKGKGKWKFKKNQT
jgi:hypothetical protein